MTEISGGNLSKTFVVVQDSQPASPFEGQIWVDTTDNTTYQYKNGSWETVSGSADGSTIIKDGSGNYAVNHGSTMQVINGNLEAVEPADLIGEFESGYGGWTSYTNNAACSVSRDTSQSWYTGSTGTGVLITTDGSSNTSDQGGIRRSDIDLTPYKYIVLDFYVDNSDGHLGMYIDGSRVGGLALGQTDQPAQWVCDVSEYNKTAQIKITSNSTGNGVTTKRYIDNIRLVKSEKTYVDQTIGAGGT